MDDVREDRDKLTDELLPDDVDMVAVIDSLPSVDEPRLQKLYRPMKFGGLVSWGDSSAHLIHTVYERQLVIWKLPELHGRTGQYLSSI